MHICILSRGVPDENSPLNGMYEWGHALTLRELGYAVTVVAVDLRIGKKRKERGLSAYEKEGIRVYDYGLPVGALKRNVAQRLRLSVIKRLFAAFRASGEMPDLVWVLFGRAFGGIALGLKDAYGVPYVICEYESRLLEGRVKKKDGVKLRRAYARASLLFAPNPAFANRLSVRFGRNFSVLPQTVSGGRMKKRHDGFVFLSIGALSVNKGMDVLLRAFAAVRKGRSDCCLVIVGRGEERRYLEEQATALGVSNAVRFVSDGDKNDLRSFFAESDCFVLASRKEYFGTIFLEAMAEGVPVITTDCFAPSGLVPRLAGRVVPVNDAVSLSVCMSEACSENAPYDGNEIAAYAKTHFSVRAVGETLERALNDLRSFHVAPDLS